MKKLNSWIIDLNEKLAVKSVIMMSTMWCVYVFLVWSIVIPLIWPSITSVVFFISGGIIQLVSLPLIMVGQSIMGRDSDVRAKHIEHEINNIGILVEELHEVLDDLHQIMSFNQTTLIEFKSIEDKIDSIFPKSKE